MYTALCRTPSRHRYFGSNLSKKSRRAVYFCSFQLARPHLHSLYPRFVCLRGSNPQTHPSLILFNLVLPLVHGKKKVSAQTSTKPLVMHVPTPTLERRKTSSSSSLALSSSSLDCSGKNASSSQCEKPASNNALEIGLGVAIPLFLILVVLGFFLFRNYRKEKKELLDHDPDFDENGDATALPDFPAFTKEDPFRNAAALAKEGSIGYPMALNSKHMSDMRSVSSRQFNGEDLTYVDGFVLPYQNQIGSKASLDEFARALTDLRSFNMKRGSEYLNFPLQNTSLRASPEKSGKRQAQTSPVKQGKHSGNYTNLPNASSGLLGNEKFFNAETNIREDSTDASKSSSHETDQFGIEYENELNPAINSTFPSSNKEFALAQHLKDSSDIESVDDDDDDDDEITGHYANLTTKDESYEVHQSTLPSFDVLSPFEDKHEAAQIVDPVANESPAVREPRMSAFDMLQNVSDDEGEGESKKKMTTEQEEELARMKSVYKVYFDRANSTSSRKDGKPDKFEADASQPLPELDVDNLKINSQLKGDTSYDKRKTTASSIYGGVSADSPDGNVIHPYQQFNVPHHPYPEEYQQQQYQQYQQYQQLPSQMHGHYDEDSQPSPEDKLPLKSLPYASDIRNSTIETFTNYQPRVKVNSPSMRLQQQGYFEGESLGSPHMSPQGSFSGPNTPKMKYTEGLPPMLRDNSGNSAKPSPSQLSRTSVVMLNPVNEIQTLRTFKPAGSLPRGMNYGYSNDEMATSDDLIPGNRKSAVRRMMNSNF